MEEVLAFGRWLMIQPAQHKIYVFGNHDEATQEYYVREALRRMGIYCLLDQKIMLAGLRFHGSPWTPTFGNWAWMEDDLELAKQWQKIEDGDRAPDVLVTHGPPRGVLDRNELGQPCGSQTLLDAVERCRHRLHAFGHIHEARGSLETWPGGSTTTFLNVASLGRDYRTLHEPVVWDLEPRDAGG